jgi:hypothetical protein
VAESVEVVVGLELEIVTETLERPVDRELDRREGTPTLESVRGLVHQPTEFVDIVPLICVCEADHTHLVGDLAVLEHRRERLDWHLVVEQVVRVGDDEIVHAG